MTIGKGTRASKLTMRFKNDCDAMDICVERGKDDVTQITETPDQWVVRYGEDTYKFFPKENLAFFIVQTEEFELVSQGGVIIPDSQENLMKEPF